MSLMLFGVLFLAALVASFVGRLVNEKDTERTHKIL